MSGGNNGGRQIAARRCDGGGSCDRSLITGGAWVDNKSGGEWKDLPSDWGEVLIKDPDQIWPKIRGGIFFSDQAKSA